MTCTDSDQQGCHTVELDAWNWKHWLWRSGTLVSVGGMKTKNVNGMSRLALFGCLEFGRGVGTLPPNLRFRKHLNSTSGLDTS